MPTTSPACRSCGAALRPDADRCDLCGTPVGETLDPTAHSPEASLDEGSREVPPTFGAQASTECARCGHLNPEGSRYCNRCGEALTAGAGQTVAPTRPASVPPSAEPASGERPPSDVGRQAMLFVSAALGIVVVLYALTAFFGGRDAEVQPAADPVANPEGVAAASNPLPDGPAPSLPEPTQQAQADAFEAQDTAEGFYESARYYLTAAFENQQTQPEASRLWAHEAVIRLEQSLEKEENPDVRVALAEAAVFEGVSPMRPIQEAQAVLEANPTHPGANLFIGQRRLMIGRTEQAREAFQTVIANTEPGDPARQSAESALAMIESGTVPGVQ